MPRQKKTVRPPDRRLERGVTRILRALPTILPSEEEQELFEARMVRMDPRDIEEFGGPGIADVVPENY